MTGARPTIAVTITFIKSNKDALESRAGAYRSGNKKKNLFMEVSTAVREYLLLCGPDCACRFEVVKRNLF